MDFTSLSPQQVLDLAKPAPEYEEVLKSKPKHNFDYSDHAKILATFRHLVNVHLQADKPDPEVSEETVEAPARDGLSLPIRVFRAAKPSTPVDGEKSGSSPLVVLYFGGSFIFGDPMTMAVEARSLVKAFNAVVAAPAYRLAPEYPFPYGYNDGWDSLRWIAENASSVLRADPSKGFIVGGVSAGANISNINAHLARDNDLQPPITGLYLACPGVRLAPKDADKLSAKYRERYLSRTQDECVQKDGSAKFKKDSLKPDPDSHIFAPMIWPTDAGHKGLPKTYSQVCGIDAPRDEMLIFDDMLKSEGIPTRMDLYAGLPHAFWYLYREIPQRKKWQKDTLDGFRWLLES